MTRQTQVNSVLSNKALVILLVLTAGFSTSANAVFFHIGSGSIDGSLCIGLDCPATPAFGFDTLRLQENNLRFHFDDTSVAAAFPRRDWRLFANDSTNGGADHFSIEDSTAGFFAFRIFGDSLANALVIDAQGDVGLGTTTPALDLEIVRGDTPSLRLQQNGSSGFTPQTWDVAGNEAGFFVRDATGGSTLPLRIRPTAPSSSIDIAGSGNVGIGASSPTASLHVRRTNGMAQLLVEEASGTTAARDLFKVANNGPTKIIMDDTSVANDWAINFSGVANELRFSDQDSPSVEMKISSGGDVEIMGMLMEMSDRNAKTNIRDLDRDDILERVARLPISRWQYIKDDGVDHIGPMAQDFYAEFGLGETDTHIGTIDTVGVALAAIQALAHENKALKAGHRELLAAYHQQQQELERMDQLEQVVARIAEKQSANEAIFTTFK